MQTTDISDQWTSEYFSGRVAKCISFEVFEVFPHKLDNFCE